jgi:hypothetical protein
MTEAVKLLSTLELIDIYKNSHSRYTAGEDYYIYEDHEIIKNLVLSHTKANATIRALKDKVEAIIKMLP